MSITEIDKKKIESLLPHREPMLLIDKLTKSFSLPVYQLAKAMMLDAEKSIFNPGSSKKINFYEGNQKIKNLF